MSDLSRVTQAKCQNAGLIGGSSDVKSLLWSPVILEYPQDLITVKEETKHGNSDRKLLFKVKKNFFKRTFNTDDT